MVLRVGAVDHTGMMPGRGGEALLFDALACARCARVRYPLPACLCSVFFSCGRLAVRKCDSLFLSLHTRFSLCASTWGCSLPLSPLPRCFVALVIFPSRALASTALGFLWRACVACVPRPSVGGMRVVRPLGYVREGALRAFAAAARLPVIEENCPACFDGPTVR